MDDNLKNSLLRSIELGGSADSDIAPVRVIINGELNNIIDRSSGKPRIRANRVGQFNLILSQPVPLKSLSPFEIRCLNCHKVISYPSWYLELRFDRNTFHYFVCFSEVSPSKVALTCGVRR